MDGGVPMLLLITAILMVAPADPVADAPTVVIKAKKICRSEETTGSRFSKQTCHTKEEWNQIAEANRRDTRLIKNHETGEN